MISQDEFIWPGDLFVKKWGDREMQQLFIYPLPNSAKSHYLRLHTGTTESTWSTHRRDLTVNRRFPNKTWRYIGRVPEPYLGELMDKGTLR